LKFTNVPWVLVSLQQRFTGFIPNDVMALPSQPFGDGRSNRRGHKDDCVHGLAFYRLGILGYRQPNAHGGACSNLARHIDIPMMALDNVLADSHP